MTFQQDLESRLAAAVTAVLGEPAAAPVTAATDLRFGDYQSNAAMVLAKQRKTNPRALATEILEKIDLIGSGATGAILKVAAVPSFGGDGKINVGLIDATGMNLAKVKVAGDLTAFVGGSDDFSIPGLGY